jgi:hypothetical protein
LFVGYGYTPYFVEASEADSMHQAKATALEHCILEIRKIRMRRCGPARRRGRAGLWSFCGAQGLDRPAEGGRTLPGRLLARAPDPAAGRPLQLRSRANAGKMAAQLRAGALRRSGPTHPGTAGAAAYRIPSAIILALPKTSISASKSITKVNRSIPPSLARGSLQFIWQCHPKRKPSILNAILSQAQDGHFCSAIFFEEHAGPGSSQPFFITATSARKPSGCRRWRPGEEKMKFKVRKVRRRSTDAELWRTAFARETKDVLDLVQVRLACPP